MFSRNALHNPSEPPPSLFFILPTQHRRRPLPTRRADAPDANQVEAYNTERALKKVKRHSSSDVIEVDEPNIKLKEHKNPYVFKEIGESLKYHENRLKKELNRRRSENDGVEIRTFSSQQGAGISGENVKSRISGPSNWDPYSKGIAPDFLRRLQLGFS